MTDLEPSSNPVRLYRHAVPRYYAEFREKVLRGERIVCNEIKAEMARIDALVAADNIYYDPEPVEGFIEFCETELVLTDGSDLIMLDEFKLWAEQLLGWYYFEELTVPMPRPDGKGTMYVRQRTLRRLINEQYLIVARSNAKSIYVSCLQAYFLVVDTHTTTQVTVAPTMAQADEVLSPIRNALARARGPVFKMLTQGSIFNTTGSKKDRPKLCSFLTDSILKILPMATDKLQGSRAMMFTVDEWLSGDTREDPSNAIKQSAAKNKDWFLLMISSEGTVRNSIGDTIKIELANVLKGEYQDVHRSIWWYKLDDIQEVNDPEMWIKACPNIGKTVSYETYTRAVQEMEANPTKRNDTLAKRFGLPMEGFAYYFKYEDTLPTLTRQEYWQMPCAMGADMSLGDDFCSFTFLFPLRKDEFGIKTLCFISELTLHRLDIARRYKYEEFMKEGSLRVMPGMVLDMPSIYDEIERYIEENEYDVLAFGYDPWNAKPFVERWEMNHTPFGVEKVPQGARTESVPLGELGVLVENHKLIFDQEMISWTMQHCIALTDNNGNRKLVKRRSDEKIDAIAALLDAYVAFKAHRERFE